MIYAANAIIRAVGDEDVTGAVDGDTLWKVHERVFSGTTVTATGGRRSTFLPISGHGGDLLRGHVDLADSGVSEIGDIQVAMGVESECGRLAQDGSRSPECCPR